MFKNIFIFILAAIILTACEQTDTVQEQSVLQYPSPMKVDTVYDFWGTKVADPYCWMENEQHDSLSQWINQENEVTFNYLEKIPYRNAIKKRLEKVWNYPKYSTPFKEGENYFFYKNDGLQNQSVLYIQKGLEGKPEVFLDPNTFSNDGTVALSGFSVSGEGKYAAYGVAAAGSDWKDFHVMNVKTKEKLDDHLKWIKFSSVSWYKDGFFYSRFDEPIKKDKKLSQKNEFHKVYYHKIGTDQSEDQLIHKNDDRPQRTFYTSTTKDEKYLIIYLSEGAGSTNAFYYKDLENDRPVTPVIDNFDNRYSIIDNIGDRLLVKTNKDAPKYRLVLIDPENPSEDNWEEVIPEGEDVLEGVQLAGGKIVAEYMKNASSRLLIYNMEGVHEGEIELPTLGTASFSGEKDNETAFYTFTSYTYPTTIYKYNFTDNSSEVFYKPEIDFDPSQYETKQVFYKSKDGTKVSMFLSYKKGLEMNGKNPTLLYGYGGFNISIQPHFSVSRLILLENGGVYAVANLRGGSEYGEEWHKAGMLLKKQNVFDDFISASEYLIDEGYTSPDKLAIEGRSNGGLLVGACMTQRPDLYAVALPGVGVMDMLRFHKFTIGWAWVSEYGSSEDSVHFENLYDYSPLHNIQQECYPATLVTTADHDDRVVPAHSFKFAATLQQNQQCNNPALIRIETKAGHGAGKPTSKKIEEAADTWAFVFYNMGVEPSYE